MLQTAFRPSCMNRVSVFGWHQRFKEGRESVRNDDRCGRSKKVNTPELIGQIKNFMDKDRRVSIETISAQFDVSVGTVHTIIREELKMRKICAKFVPKVLREDKKERSFYETIEEMKRAVTKVIDTLTQEDFDGPVVGTVQQVHCSRRRLLRRGLEFHVCTINKSAHTKKVWKLIEGTSYDTKQSDGEAPVTLEL